MNEDMKALEDDIAMMIYLWSDSENTIEGWKETGGWGQGKIYDDCGGYFSLPGQHG